MNVWGGERLILHWGWWTSGVVNVWGGERLGWWTSGVVNVWVVNVLQSDKNTPHDMIRFESPKEIMFSKCNYSIPAFDSHFSPSKHNRFYIRWERSCFEIGFNNRAIPRRASYLQRSENERRHSKGIPTVKLSQPILSKLKSQIHFLVQCSMPMYNRSIKHQ